MWNSQRIIGKLREQKAQILLPSVLLAPIFVLVIYLLFETAKVSMTKVRQQFALDNAAYSQVSSASTYLNAMAMVNGPLPYRVFLELSERGSEPFNQPLPPVGGRASEPAYIFDLFYKGGGFPAVGSDHNTGRNDPPSPESTDWKQKYYEGPEVDPEFPRSEWEKENPTAPSGDKYVPVMSKELTNNYFFMTRGGHAVQAIVFYLETYARVGSVYRSQDYVYQELSKNAIMFREAYYLNVNDCKRSECARQSAAQLRPYLGLKTTPFELSKIHFFASEASGGSNAGAYAIPFEAEEVLSGQKLFQFAYLDPSSRSKLKSLARGISLKQPFKLPRNHFNINLEQKYKPYVRNRVVLACPRNSNNCVWPNPLPKYNVTLEP